MGLLAVELLGVERVHVIEREPRRAALVPAGGGAPLRGRPRCAWSKATSPMRARGRPSPTWSSGCTPAAPLPTPSSTAPSPPTRAGSTSCPAATPRAWPSRRRRRRTPMALGVPRHAEVRKRVVMSLVDAERTLRLEAAGWETTVAALVPPSVTPYNLMWRARRMREPQRMTRRPRSWRAPRAPIRGSIAPCAPSCSPSPSPSRSPPRPRSPAAARAPTTTATAAPRRRSGGAERPRHGAAVALRPPRRRRQLARRRPVLHQPGARLQRQQQGQDLQRAVQRPDAVGERHLLLLVPLPVDRPPGTCGEDATCLCNASNVCACIPVACVPPGDGGA